MRTCLHRYAKTKLCRTCVTRELAAHQESWDRERKALEIQIQFLGVEYDRVVGTWIKAKDELNRLQCSLRKKKRKR